MFQWFEMTGNAGGGMLQVGPLAGLAVCKSSVSCMRLCGSERCEPVDLKSPGGYLPYYVFVSESRLAQSGTKVSAAVRRHLYARGLKGKRCSSVMLRFGDQPGFGRIGVVAIFRTYG